VMSGCVESDAEGGMRRDEEFSEVGVLPVGVDRADRVAPCDGAAVRPYPTVVDPFKRRVALREYVRQLRGDNKENERGKECEVSEKSPVSSSVPKQKTLGLCRRHVGGATAVAVSGGQGEGMLRDKRKFNAPRQTPEKRQRPDEVNVSAGTELPRLQNRMVVEDGSEDVRGGMRQPVFQFASREHEQLEPAMRQVTGGDEADVVAGARWSQSGVKDSSPSPARSPSRQTQLPDSYSLPFKWQAPEPKTPTLRKPLAPVNIPVNGQTVELHPSPMDQLPSNPNFSGRLERNGSVPSGSLFQTASGKPFHASAASKARAALLFESDAELADFFALEL
jgi:hypothetical protein